MSPEILNERRKHAVRLRLNGAKVAEVCQQTGLSAPTVSAAWKAFCKGGWAAVPVKPRGRLKGQAKVLDADVQAALWQAVYQAPQGGQPGWSSACLAAWLKETHGTVLTQRAIEHWWTKEGLHHAPWPLERLAKQRSPYGRWYRKSVAPLWAKFREADHRWQGGVRHVAHPDHSVYQLFVHGRRGKLFMRCFEHPPQAADYLALFAALNREEGAVLVFHGACFELNAEVMAWLNASSSFWLVPVPPGMALSE